MKRETFDAQIPFSGFYNSIHDSEIDRVWESECEYFAESAGYDMPEWASDYYWTHCDFSHVHENYAKEYVESFLAWLELDGKYDGMTSPRFYNFETDRVFAKLTRSDVARLFFMVKRSDLAEMARKRFTSCDGFISHYSPDIREWGPLSEWDHNQIGTLVLCAANAESSGDFDSYDEYELMETAMCNGDIDNWVWGSNEKMTRLGNALYYLRERGKRKIKTLDQWHAARRAEMRPFNGTPLGAFAETVRPV